MADVERLCDPAWKGRRAGTPEGRQAALWVASRMHETGLSPLPGRDFLIPFGEQMANVAGILPGLGEGWVVLGAHYDHLGEKDGRIWPGADDNASGVAVLLETARRLSASAPFEHSIAFLAFDSEEQGLKGARAFVEDRVIPPERIRLLVNMDMMGRALSGHFIFRNVDQDPGWRPRIQGICRELGIRPQLNAKVGERGDHAPFLEAGVPCLKLGTGVHADYHQPSDTVDKVEAAGMRLWCAFLEAFLPPSAREAPGASPSGLSPRP